MSEYFSRQVKFIGKDNQEKLSKAKVTVVGCGSLGSFVISALVRSGIGFVRIIDRDYVEESNLYANEAYELMKSIPKGIGVNFMITQKDSNKVVARLDKCPVYESSKLAGLEPGEFCNHSAIPYFRAVAKQLNMNLDYQQNKCKASEADFCEEQVFLKK